MKTKSFLVVAVSLFALGVFLIVSHSQPPPSLHTVLSQTHQHIKHFQDNLRDVSAAQLVSEERYAELLGLTAPGAPPEHPSAPALVSHARGSSPALAVSFVRAAARLPYPVLLYNLGLTTESRAIVCTYCNSSKCSIIDFDLSQFPSHVSDESIHAYRPLIIQHAAHRVGGVIYVESDTRWWGAGAGRALDELWARARAGAPPGVLAWPRRRAVTSVTHPRMFRYLRAAPDDFLFVRQLAADRLVVSGAAARAALTAWVRCALTADCIMPIGATLPARGRGRGRGCRFDKKPQYRYSGCHGADASALSIIVSQRAAFDDARYAVRARLPRWRRVSLQAADRELAALRANLTTTAILTPPTTSASASASPTV